MSNRINLFVYAPVEKGSNREELFLNLKGQGFMEYAGFGFTKPNYDLLDFGGFPGLTYGNFSVYGDIFSIDEDVLPELDKSEMHPELFKRDKVVLEDGEEASSYFFNLDERGKMLLNAFATDHPSRKEKVLYTEGMKMWYRGYN